MRFGRDERLGRRLRRERPEPPRDLHATLMRRIAPAPVHGRPMRVRFALGGGLVAALVAFGALGGISEAATTAKNAFDGTKTAVVASVETPRIRVTATTMAASRTTRSTATTSTCAITRGGPMSRR